MFRYKCALFVLYMEVKLTKNLQGMLADFSVDFFILQRG